MERKTGRRKKRMKQTVFDYFYGQEAESFSFYRIPKVLFTDERFAGLTSEAKVLYGLMLDRMSLSIRNGWLDDDGKVFIIFRIDDICELIGCASQKAVKLVHELDDVKGICLIEKHRGGLGDANVFYIKNFMMPLEISDEKSLGSEKEAENGVDSQNCENHKTGIVKITNQQFRKSQNRNCENQNSGIVKTTNQEFRKSQSNNTDNNQTERSDTESIYPSGGESVPYEVPAPEMIDVMEGCRGFVRKNIEYDCYLGESRSELEAVDELVELIAEVLAMPDTGTIRINGNDMPAVLVKKQYYKLRHDHIDYVRWTMKHNTTKVANIRAYLLTALYNSIITIGHYYESEANYDMSGRSDE
jgi:hypothetical protein